MSYEAPLSVFIIILFFLLFVNKMMFQAVFINSPILIASINKRDIENFVLCCYNIIRRALLQFILKGKIYDTEFFGKH